MFRFYYHYFSPLDLSLALFEHNNVSYFFFFFFFLIFFCKAFKLSSYTLEMGDKVVVGEIDLHSVFCVCMRKSLKYKYSNVFTRPLNVIRPSFLPNKLPLSFPPPSSSPLLSLCLSSLPYLSYSFHVCLFN